MKLIFADTFYWVALTNPRDDWHKVVQQTRESFLQGLALYESRLDKEYSLTDCISMQIMRQLGITEVLTHERHFNQ